MFIGKKKKNRKIKKSLYKNKQSCSFNTMSRILFPLTLACCFFLLSCSHFKQSREPQNNAQDTDAPEVSSLGDILVSSDITPIQKTLVDSIIKQTDQHLQTIQSNCDNKKPQLQSVKNIAKQLQQLHNYADETYRANRYSFDGVQVKDGNSQVNLAVFLEDINSILSDDRIKYIDIEQSKDFNSACMNLKDNYIFSYKSYYNLPDNSNLLQDLSPWAQSIQRSITCLCP